MTRHAAAARAGGWVAHLAIGTLLALWGHAQWPLAFAGQLPLAAWLAVVAAWGTRRSDERVPADWAQRAARLGMLPMMAGLPAMLDLCSNAAGGLLAMAAGHAAALLLPPALLALLPASLRPGPALLCAALLLGGGALLWVAPGVQGLMLATLAHAAAWSVAVSGPQPSLQPSLRPSLQPSLRPSLQPSLQPQRRGWAAAPVFSVLAMGAALDAVGPAALFAVHAALALFGLALIVAAMRQPRLEPLRF